MLSVFFDLIKINKALISLGLLKNMWVKSEGISAEGGSAYGRHHGDTEARSRGCVNPEARCALGIHATIDIWRRKRDQDKGDVK